MLGELEIITNRGCKVLATRYYAMCAKILESANRLDLDGNCVCVCEICKALWVVRAYRYIYIIS